MSLFPAHQTYVEPFLGGGAVFWEKEPSAKEVINDLDSILVADYRRILSAPTSGYPILTTETAQNEFLRKSHTGRAEQIVESLLRRCNGFGGTYIEKGTTPKVTADDRKGRVHKVTTHEDKLKNIGEYKNRLKNATLTNESYDAVLRTHDSPTTFFFMDPPYEKSVGLDYAKGSDAFPFAKFAEDVRKLKGKFIITINDSRAIRKLFKGLTLYPYVVVGHHAKGNIGKEDRKELLITNYELPRNWKSRMTKGVLTGGRFHCEEEELTGGARGDGELIPILLQSYRVADEFREVGGGCAVLALAAINNYLNRGIEIPRALRFCRVDRPGDPRGSILWKDIIDLLEGAGITYRSIIPATMATKTPEEKRNMAESLVNDIVRTEGKCVLLGSNGHAFALIPLSNPDYAGPGGGGDQYPYDSYLFDTMMPRGTTVKGLKLGMWQSKNNPELLFHGATTPEQYLDELLFIIIIDDEPLKRGLGKTHKENVEKKLDLEPNGHSLKELSEAADVPLKTLQEVFNRGIGAYKTNPTSVRMKGTFEKGVVAPMSQKLSKEQWAQSRVYSFLDGNPKHDQDLRGDGKGKSFEHQLGTMGYSPMTYIRDVRRKAKEAGYDPSRVGFADDGTHKLEVHTPDGRTVKFGRVGYGDHLIWTHLEERGEAPEGVAEMKRRVFRKSHSAIRGRWRSDRFSPNNLALAILW